MINSLLSLVNLKLIRIPNSTIPNCWPIQTSNPLTFYEADRSFHQQYEIAQEKTQMSTTDNALRRNRHYHLYNLIRQAPISEGAVVELGCFRGLSAYQIASYIESIKANINKEFFIFDSFEGLSELQRVDKENVKRMISDLKLRNQFACSLAEVKANLTPYNHFINYFKGWIPEKFSEVANKTFSFVHIDVDLYQPILDSARFFYQRLCQNGIMVFDDYGCAGFPGAKIAVDEFLNEIKDYCFMHTTSGSAFLIKLNKEIA